MQAGYRKKVWALILIFLVLRFTVAFAIEMGNDESYYWVYSRHLQWNYFDHPPMVAVWIRAFTLNGWLDDYEGFVRAGSVFSCAFSTWFLFKAVAVIKDERSGWFAAVLFNASLYAGIVAGLLVMPDSPQLFFWTFCLWQIAKLASGDLKPMTWVLFAISAGLCIMSKVHGGFIWFGLGLFILFRKPEWLRTPMVYVAMLITAVIISPIILWNQHYDFITWQFHSARVDISKEDLARDSFWIETVQQIVINNPVNVALVVAALVATLRKRLHPALSAYHFIALPFIAMFVAVSLVRDIWYHWTGPAFTTLIPLAAIWLSEKKSAGFFPAWTRWSTVAFCLALFAWPVIINHYPGSIGSKDPSFLGQGDVTLDKYGWEEAGQRFSEIYEGEAGPDDGKMAPIVCDSWWGAHLEYYFARPVEAPVIGIGGVEKLHQYSWLNKKRMPSADMDTAYCIFSSIEKNEGMGVFRSFYGKGEMIREINVFRKGKLVSRFSVYRLSGWKGSHETLAEFSVGGH